MLEVETVGVGVWERLALRADTASVLDHRDGLTESARWTLESILLLLATAGVEVRRGKSNSKSRLQLQLEEMLITTITLIFSCDSGSEAEKFGGPCS